MIYYNRTFPGLLTRAMVLYVRLAPWDFLKSRFFYAAFRKANKNNGIIRVRTKYGTWFANPKDYVACDLFAAGVWEFSITALFERLILPGDVIVDVGANFGYYSILAANLVKDTGKVYSYECAPESLSLLMENVRQNKVSHIIKIREEALSDHTGTTKFFLNTKDSGLSSLHPGKDSKEICVQVNRLDRESFDSRLKLVKIDVEGTEIQVLKGMTGIFEKNIRPLVICEITRYYDKDGIAFHNELFEFMNNAGYRARLIKRQKRRFPPFEPLSNDFLEITRFPEEENQIDVLFVPESSHSF